MVKLISSIFLLAQRDDRPREEREHKSESASGLGRIPKVSDKLNSTRHDSPRPTDRGRSERDKLEKLQREEREKIEKLQREKERARTDRDKAEREKERLDRERLDKLRAERERIERDIDRLNRDRERLEKAKSKLEISSKLSERPKTVDKSIDRSKLNPKESMKQDIKKSIDLKSQNTYRIDKNSNEKKFTIPSKNNDGKHINGHSSHGKPVPRPKEQAVQQNGIKDKSVLGKQKTSFGDGSQKINDKRLPNGKAVPSKRPDDRKTVTSDKAGPSKPKMTNSFDFDKHVNSIGKNGARKPDGTRQFPPGDVRRKGQQNGKKRKFLFV